MCYGHRNLHKRENKTGTWPGTRNRRAYRALHVVIGNAEFVLERKQDRKTSDKIPATYFRIVAEFNEDFVSPSNSWTSTTEHGEAVERLSKSINVSICIFTVQKI